MPLRCVVFDCDGVLLDSVPVKTRAFGRLAEPWGEEARERFVAYHTAHGGVSRYQKFIWFFREIVGREITPGESEDWGRRFSEIVQDEMRRCPCIAGAEQVLRDWKGRLPLYVCSGAPAEEQRAMLAEHGLDGYFDGIFGAPPAKNELLARILKDAGIAPADALMVGDATTDRDAAAYAGTLFYGVGDLLKGGDHPWGADLTGLSAFIAGRV
ncbi:MAG: HAD family hydrolase [Desulfovibrio sp.]|jgi:phosphoglycolate phosphatase-like HAD superfamily hydrolase|nr:HAD family hydrolase [Desulfovibrio sp.]